MNGPMVDKDYQAQCDLRTLRDADEIKRNQKRFVAAQKELDKQAAALDKANHIFPGKAKKRK